MCVNYQYTQSETEPKTIVVSRALNEMGFDWPTLVASLGNKQPSKEFKTKNGTDASNLGVSSYSTATWVGDDKPVFEAF